MKILLIHNYYTANGGEDAVFEQECKLLSQRHDVEVLAFYNESGIIGALKFIASIWNIFAARTVRNKLKSFCPDIIHLHNYHFASGPIIIHTARKMRVPLVFTVHNFRLLCPSGTLFDGERLFIDSLSTKFPWGAIKKRVFRKSYLQTFWLAFIVWFHGKIGTWALVNKYLTLTLFSSKLFLKNQLDIPVHKFVTKPNFVKDLNGLEVRKENFLYVGRLSAEKGIKVLLNAFKLSQFEIHIVGTGLLYEDAGKAAFKQPNIKVLGSLNSDKVRLQMLTSTALVFPSVWFEGMPMTIIEAFSTSTPVIASDLGSMATMVTNGFNGLLFEAGNYDDLNAKLNYWANLSSFEKAIYRKNARQTYEQFYRPEANLDLLDNIYNEVLKSN